MIASASAPATVDVVSAQDNEQRQDNLIQELFSNEPFSEIDTCVEILSSAPPKGKSSPKRSSKRDRISKAAENLQTTLDLHIKPTDDDIHNMVKEDVRKMIAKIRAAKKPQGKSRNIDLGEEEPTTDKKLVRPGKYGEFDMRSTTSARARQRLMDKIRKEKSRKKRHTKEQKKKAADALAALDAAAASPAIAAATGANARASAPVASSARAPTPAYSTVSTYDTKHSAPQSSLAGDTPRNADETKNETENYTTTSGAEEREPAASPDEGSEMEPIIPDSWIKIDYYNQSNRHDPEEIAKDGMSKVKQSSKKENSSEEERDTHEGIKKSASQSSRHSKSSRRSRSSQHSRRSFPRRKHRSVKAVPQIEEAAAAQAEDGIECILTSAPSTITARTDAFDIEAASQSGTQLKKPDPSEKVHSGSDDQEHEQPELNPTKKPSHSSKPDPSDGTSVTRVVAPIKTERKLESGHVDEDTREDENSEIEKEGGSNSSAKLQIIMKEDDREAEALAKLESVDNAGDVHVHKMDLEVGRPDPDAFVNQSNIPGTPREKLNVATTEAGVIETGASSVVGAKLQELKKEVAKHYPSTPESLPTATNPTSDQSEGVRSAEMTSDATVELVLVDDAEKVRQLELENAKLRDTLRFMQQTAVAKERYFAELAWFGKRSEGEVQKHRPNFWKEKLAEFGPELFEEFRADAMRIADPDVGDWEHGFSSGSLAMARLLLGLSHAIEDEKICAFHDPDTPCTVHCVTCTVADQRKRELDDFPVLDP